MNNITKQCSRCKKEYPATLEYFNKEKRWSTGLGSWCKLCKKADDKRYYDNPKNVEKRRLRSELWYKKNKDTKVKDYNKKNREHIKVIQAKRHLKNKEKNNRISLEYYYNNKQDRLEKARLWKKEHRDHISKYNRQYRKENPKIVKFNKSMRSARERGASGKHTLEQWLNLKKEYNYTCPMCLKSEPEIKLTQDHVIPISRWDKYIKNMNWIKYECNDIENIQPLCARCNSIKALKDLRPNPLLIFLLNN